MYTNKNTILFPEEVLAFSALMLLVWWQKGS